MGVFMGGAGPHFPKFPYNIVRIHTSMIYSDIVEYNIVDDTKAALSENHLTNISGHVLKWVKMLVYQKRYSIQKRL